MDRRDCPIFGSAESTASQSPPGGPYLRTRVRRAIRLHTYARIFTCRAAAYTCMHARECSRARTRISVISANFYLPCFFRSFVNVAPITTFPRLSAFYLTRISTSVYARINIRVMSHYLLRIMRARARVYIRMYTRAVRYLHTHAHTQQTHTRTCVRTYIEAISDCLVLLAPS